MRHFVRSLAVLSALSLPLALHATTYTGTVTVTDTSTNSLVGSSAFSFNDPPQGTIFNPYDVSYTISGVNNNDALDLKISFTQPGSGSGTIGGDVDFSGFFHTNYVQWDQATSLINLSNGSILQAILPNLFGDAIVNLDSCTRHSTTQCGTSDVYLKVLDNDPPAATPEPSSLALLGTGVLTLAGAVRRRLAA